MNLTLVICVYNAARYLPATLECVVGQSVQDFKLLIIDDASTDGSVDVVKKFFAEHPRQYELIAQKKNQGIAYARHLAVDSVDTKYMLFVDADDPLDNRLVEKEYNAIAADDDLMGVSCWSNYINSDGDKLPGGTFLGEKDKTAFIEKARKGKRIFLPIHTMFNVELARKAGSFTIDGFPEGKPRWRDYCEELDLWTRMSDNYVNGKAFITLPEVLYYYRKGSGLSAGTFYMGVKMRYVKENVRRRRRGENNLTFNEFYASLTPADLRRMEGDARAADNLRLAAMSLRAGHPLRAVACGLKSVVARPGYLVDKLRKNLVKR